MKIYTFLPDSRNFCRLKQSLLIMKVTIIMLIAAFMQVQAESFAQKVSLSEKNAKLEVVLTKITNLTGYNILCDAEIIKKAHPVNIELSEVPLEEALKRVLSENGLTYILKGKTVVVKRAVGRSTKPVNEVQIGIKGTVVDKEGNPLTGATIKIKGTNSVTTTDADGAFKFNELPENATLILSFTGFVTQEIQVEESDTMLRIVLEKSDQALDEVVILGFGQKQQKIAQTGSTASITTKELTQSPVANITNALAGRLPGLIAIQRSGEPGDDASELYIRGRATLNSSAPLVTIDGIEKDYSSITKLDPNEIENVTILKDASATALYGVKGANGVIIVTTRRGKEGKPVISFSTQTAMQTPTSLPEYLRSYDHARLSNEAYLNENPGGTLLPYSEEALEAYRTGSDPLKYPDVDWINEFLKNSFLSQTNFNISGGSKQVRYFVNVGYMDQDGMFKTEKNDVYDPTFEFKRYNFRSNIDIDFDEDFSVALNLFGGIENKNTPGVTATSIFTVLTQNAPNQFPIRYPTGFLAGDGIRNNPYERLNETGFIQHFNSSLSGMISATRKLNFITKGLSAKVNYSFDGYFTNQFKRTKQVRRAFYNGEGDYEDPANYTYRYEDIPLGPPSSTFSQNRDTWIDVSLSYQHAFGKHDVSGLMLANRQQKVRGGAIPYVSQGLVTRLTYSYDNKYFAEFNAGFNGTDNFAKENRYGFFPAVSAGWVIARDGDVLNFLKVRGSFGLNGNDQLTGTRRWLFLSEFQKGTGYSFGEQLKSIPGIQEGPLSNPLITWEKAKRSNVGLEVNLFGKGILNLSTDLFYEKRRDMLVIPQNVPFEVGVISSALPPANFGVTENKGFETELSHRYKIGQVNYFINGNVSYARNKILEMTEETKLWPNLARTGHPIGQHFTLIALGFFNSQEEIDNSPEQTFGPVIPGDIKYRDVNRDGKIDNNDETAVGKSPVPEVMYGISGGINWKNADFSFLLQGATNFSLIKSLEVAYEFYNRGKVMTEHLGRWTPETAATATYPVLHTGLNANNHRGGLGSSFFLQDASYLRLKNVEVGYTFRNIQLTSSKSLSSVRLYFNGMNLITWASINGGVDPEAPSGRYATYPQVKVFNFGVSAKF